MADIVSPAVRSRMMSGIRGSNTKPERKVRSFLHGLGFRFRLHVKNLPGRPDIILPKYGAAVFVHGCFWHRHPGCRFAYNPKSNQEKWNAKFFENVTRDERTAAALLAAGWRVFVVWECEVSNPKVLENLARELRKVP